jgi:four helix bundle protein
LKDYKELEVWQKAMDLAEHAYKQTRLFPSEERYGLTSQIRRSAASIPANIAEGWGRFTTSDYVHFLVIARGSLLELETHMLLSHRLGFLAEHDLADVQRLIVQIGRMLNALITRLRSQSH